jgi:hypothetical protein
MSLDYQSWFSTVKQIHAANGGGGLADQEDWHEYFENQLTPEQALEEFLRRHEN